MRSLGESLARVERRCVPHKQISTPLGSWYNMHHGAAPGQAIMSKHFHYVHLPNLHHLMEGLTFNVPHCAEVLDSALVQFNIKTKIPDKIVAWNKRGGNLRKPLSFPGRGRIIIDLTAVFNPSKGIVHLAHVLEKKNEKDAAPVVFFTMRSISLDIPMRVEVPLRALVKGGPKLKGTYTVYLHALLGDDGQASTYYGITKRGWNLRFIEHVKGSFQPGSRRLFPMKLNELVEARVAERTGRVDLRPKLSGIVSAVCAIGLDEDAALDTEEYLVDKYSLSSKHPNGLNMIPGGREGIRSIHKLSGRTTDGFVETEDREAALDEYLTRHPQLGISKPGVAEKWNDPAYAEAVICARENRLSADQVREIRYLAALGTPKDEIRAATGALNDGQVSRVIEGRTYIRIR